MADIRLQLPTLASTSRSPAVHHLSSVGALIPAPRRTIYAASKAAGLMAVESCRVECEGSGVRFFCEPSYLPNADERILLHPKLLVMTALDCRWSRVDSS